MRNGSEVVGARIFCVKHVPVLLREVMELLNPQKGEVFLDATLGLGNHAKAILEKLGSEGKLIGLDLDERNLGLAKENLKEFENLETHYSNFCDLDKFTKLRSLDGILMDLGVSSLHFDDAERGFSFQNLGKLDMRFDASQDLDAAKILNSFSEQEIADILYRFGEIRSSCKLAKKITEARRKKKFSQTEDLLEVIENKRLLPQIFQALRIRVNDELGSLREGLNKAYEALKLGGRIGVISFHSLEDRIVKNFFREKKQAGKMEIITKKPIIASKEEIEANSRSRSAKLRVAKKI